MRVLLFLGLAFEALANRLQRGLVLRVERILQWPPSGTIALAHHLQHLDGSDQRRGGQVLEWPILGDTPRLDIEALGFHRPKHLLDGPALTVKMRDLERIRE